MAVDELVGEVFSADETQRLFAPLDQVPVQVFLRNEIATAAGDSHHPDMIIDNIDLGLVLETARIDVDEMAELGELLGQLQHIDDLAAGIGRA